MMLRSLLTSLCLVTLAALLSGCKEEKPLVYTPTKPVSVERVEVTAANQQTLFPFKEGNQWTFSLEVTREIPGQQPRTGKSEVTYRVAQVVPQGSGVRARLEVLQEDNIIDRQVWSVDDTGLYQVSVSLKDINYSTPQPTVSFPAETNKKFKWQGTGVTPMGEVGRSTVESKILGIQDVDADSGRFGALGIAQYTVFNIGGKYGYTDSSLWLKPGVGMVRYLQTTTYQGQKTLVVLKLKNYSLKS